MSLVQELLSSTTCADAMTFGTPVVNDGLELLGNQIVGEQLSSGETSFKITATFSRGVVPSLCL
jgi:hypothetical protein